jgi:hypothetical protein
MIRSREIALAMALCLAALAGSCSGDKGTNSDGDNGGGESPFLPRTSARNLLRNLATAYAERDSVAYDSLLARDFRSFFSEDDQEIGEGWTLEDEHDAHARMFGSEDVLTLTLSFNLGAVELDEERTTVDDSLYASIISSVNLLLYGRTPAFPDEVAEYQVLGAREKFWFRKNGWTDPANGLPVWSIVEWMALEPAASKEHYTWREIKALFLAESKAP